MKVKSRVLLGLILLIVLVGGYSIINQLSEMEDIFNPSDVYACLGDTKTGGFSNVSYASGSAGADAPVGVASSMPSHNAAFSYARAVSAPVGAMGSTSAYSQVPMAGGQGLYTTSSEELRSFGGGGNGGGSVSMSGGVAKSSGSSAGSSVSLGVSTPGTPVLAVNNNRNSNISVLPNISGEVVASPVATYAGIGNTTGGASRGLGGKKAAPGLGGGWWTWFDSWVSEYGDGYSTGEEGSYILDRYALESAYKDFIASYWNSGMGDAPEFEEWLDWYLQAMSDGDGSYKYGDHTYYWQPVGDIWPLLVMLLMYAGYVVLRRRKAATTQND